MLPPLFEVRDVSVVRSGRVILEVNHFQVAAGSHTVIVGPNGSGKSTLVGLLMGTVRPYRNRGTVCVQGEPSLSQAELRRRIAVIDSEDTGRESFRAATVLEVIMSGPLGTHGRVLPEQFEPQGVAAAQKMAEHLGLLPWLDRQFATLSTGEKKRTLIARALLQDPVALILDEPTNGLDEEARNLLLNHLSNLSQSRATLILVTHRPDEQLPLFPQKVVIREGRIATEHLTGRGDSLLERMKRSSVYDVAVRTPLQLAPLLSRRLGAEIYLKREDLQPVYSFKIRGAYQKLSSLTVEARSQGVVTASAGNHAQGVALSARALGISAMIVVPTMTPEIKIAAIRELGAELVLHGDSFDDASQFAQCLADFAGRPFIHPYDDEEVIVGQGTVGIEIADAFAQPIEAIFVPVGGGGLISGVAVALKQLKPGIIVIGVEAEDSAAMASSLAVGKRLTLAKMGQFADGCAVKTVGVRTFALVTKWVDEVITVTNDEICAAVKDIFEDRRALVEPAGALGLAGLKKWCESNTPTGPLVTILSGANLNFERLQFIAERTKLGSHKEAILAIRIPETPGSFSKLCQALGNRSLTEFNYRMGDPAEAVVFVGLATQGIEDHEHLLKSLIQQKFIFEDLTHEEVAKLHVRHMVGGRSTTAQNEILFRAEFPERAGALSEFLFKLRGRWNISLFHYRNHGADRGRALIGFEVPPDTATKFARFISSLSITMEEQSAASIRLFLQANQ